MMAGHSKPNWLGSTRHHLESMNQRSATCYIPELRMASAWLRRHKIGWVCHFYLDINP